MKTTNKPDWKDAPEWANWLAMDADGRWYWYHNTPYVWGDMWGCSGNFDYSGHIVSTINDNWYETLEERPRNQITI